jgi:predicted P-loop ATPase
VPGAKGGVLTKVTALSPATDWRPALIKGRTGRPIWCAENACATLENDPAWTDVLAYDEFVGLFLVLRPIPGTTAPRNNFAPRPLAENDITATVRWFNRNGFPDATKNTTADAMHSVASQAVISPVRHYLDGLNWDGQPRVDTWLSRYCSSASDAFTSKAGAAWLISAAARALSPGCKADCALVLEGRQGAGKSSAIKALAGEAWFHDGLHDLQSKDASAALRGRWIIELPELSAMRRSDVEAVKAFLSRTDERYRPPYGRAEVVEPRRCVFAGTTNRTDYLTDDTGGRRFWPVAVGQIDVDRLIRDRDQIWAEAVLRFRNGEKWWLDRETEVLAAKVVAARAAEDPWEADVLRVVAGLREVSTPEIFERLDVPRDRRSKPDAMRITGILTRAGWINGGRFTGGPSKGVTRYLPPKAEDEWKPPVNPRWKRQSETGIPGER